MCAGQAVLLHHADRSKPIKGTVLGVEVSHFYVSWITDLLGEHLA